MINSKAKKEAPVADVKRNWNTLWSAISNKDKSQTSNTCPFIWEPARTAAGSPTGNDSAVVSETAKSAVSWSEMWSFLQKADISVPEKMYRTKSAEVNAYLSTLLYIPMVYIQCAILASIAARLLPKSFTAPPFLGMVMSDTSCALQLQHPLTFKLIAKSIGAAPVLPVLFLLVLMIVRLCHPLRRFRIGRHLLLSASLFFISWMVGFDLATLC